jgi:hypothetical protein
MPGDPLERSARRLATASSGVIAVAGVIGGAVRLLPWLLDPSVPWAVAVPFARELVSAALEAALVVGWPVGWALACVTASERGEALVLQALGESPATSVARFTRHGVVLAASLTAFSLIYATDAAAPGRVVNELVMSARLACASWTVSGATPRTFTIPFTEMTFLCAPGHVPLIAGPAPGSVAQGAFFVAHDAHVGGDLRSLELDRAHIVMGRSHPIIIGVNAFSVHGMPSWSHASSLPPALRAGVLSLTSWATGSIAALAALHRLIRTRAVAIALSALGPLVGLAILRALERSDVPLIAYACVPLAAAASEVAGIMVADRLRARESTATSPMSVSGLFGLGRRGRR